MHLDFKSLFDAYLTAVKRWLPKPSQSAIGIDIGTSCIKAVALSGAGNAPQLSAWTVEKIVNGNVPEALGKVLARIRLNNQPVVASVSGKGTLIRYIDLPRMPLEDLRRSFVYDLDKYFPFDPESIYSDCFILDTQSRDKRMPVLVAAVKKEIVDERLKLFKEAGAEASYLTINSIAIANAFEHLGPTLSQGGQAKAILDVGGSVSNLLVIKDRSPRFTRDIFTGSHDMTRQIANSLGLDPAKAEALKCSPSERSEEVMNACEAAVGQLVAEIRLSLDYFMTEKNVQVDEFFLMGGGSLLKGIDQIFEKNLGIPVKTWNPLAGINMAPEAAGSDIQSYSSQLGVALGLALTAL